MIRENGTTMYIFLVIENPSNLKRIRINVSVELTKYKPVDMDFILEKLEK